MEPSKIPQNTQWKQFTSVTTKVDLFSQHLRASSTWSHKQIVIASETFCTSSIYCLLTKRPRVFCTWKVNLPSVYTLGHEFTLVTLQWPSSFQSFQREKKKPLRKQLTKKIGDRPLMKIYIIRKGTHCSIPSDKAMTRQTQIRDHIMMFQKFHPFKVSVN